MRIALYGEGGVGKSYIAQILVEEYGFVEMAFADEVYRLARKHFNMTGKDREILVGLGESARDLYYNVWVDILHQRMQMLDADENIVVSDLRRHNEYYYLLSEDFLPVKIEADFEATPEGLNNTKELMNEGHTKGELEGIGMATLTNTKDDKQLRAGIETLVRDYDYIFEHRTRRGRIKYD